MKILFLLIPIGVLLYIVLMVRYLTKADKKRCDHTQNYRVNKFLSPDGTPMIDFFCFDCEYHDHGHVYADAEGWEENKIVRNGKKVLFENG